MVLTPFFLPVAALRYGDTPAFLVPEPVPPPPKLYELRTYEPPPYEAEFGKVPDLNGLNYFLAGEVFLTGDFLLGSAVFTFT